MSGVERSRWIVGAVGLIVLGLAGVSLWLRGRSGRAPSRVDLTAAPESAAREPELRGALTPAAVEPEEVRRALPMESPSSPAAERERVECTVFGLVLDETERGLSGVNVRLESVGNWAEDAAVARLPGADDRHGFELATARGGTFRFVVPLPAAEAVWLSLELDAFHEAPSELLADVGATLPRLRSGDNDLGVFRLRTTGAIRGAVRDEGGLPLENARVDLPDAETPLRVRSDVRGEYFLAHVPPGPHEISAEHDRHASALARCEVEPRLVTDGVDFVLRAASTLSGVVVDDRGRGLAGATVRASPVQGGAMARAESEADGRFTILLKEAKPHTLSASLEGFLPFGELDSRRQAPGADDLRIVLQRSTEVLTRFVVVDAASRAPVERFGIEIGYDGVSASRSGWRKDARPEPVEHRNGEVELPARPGQDVYTVVAPGYLRNRDEVRHESPESRRQVVELMRGGAIVGRVVDAGSPAAEVGVRLVPGRLVSGGPTTSRFAENGAVLTTRTDAQGRFRFDALEPGTFRVLARGADGFVERVPVELGLAGDLDLGDLELLAWATIFGRVLVPPRRSAGGLEVELQDPLAPEKTTTDAEGRFRFGELTAGEHRLVVREVPRELAHGASATVPLAAGEAKEVEIDARDRGTCDVELRIELSGRTAEGLRVSLYPVVPGDGIVLGTTDTGGRVAGWAPAWGEARVEIATEGLTLKHPTARLVLELDRDVDTTVRFDVGGFVLELPGAAPWPRRGWGRLKLVPEGADGEAGAVAMVFRSDAAAGGATGVEGDRRLRCDLAPAGRFQATLEVQDLDAQPKPSVVYGTTFALEIRAGSVAEFRLP